MILPYFFVAVAISFVIAAVPAGSARRKFDGSIAGILILIAAFVYLYLEVPVSIAQDRYNYFLWYRDAWFLAEHLSARDRLFSEFLLLFPDRMDPTGFGAVFSFIFIATLAAVAIGIAGRFRPARNFALTLLLVVIVDRVFWDLALNTTRSTLCGVLFLAIFATRNRLLQLAALFLSFGFHALMFLALASLLILALLLQRFRWTVQGLATAALTVFLYRAATGESLIAGFEQFNVFVPQFDSQRELRGLNVAGVLSSSLTAQTALAAVIPVLLAFNTRLPKPVASTASPPNALSLQFGTATLWSFGMAAASVSLLLYPDFALAKRFFIVPMIALLVFVRNEHLYALVAAKFLLLIAFLDA